ncbi:MAG TPA: cytochrome c biogenesis protein ResB, partial [Marmoricola sp.]
VYDRLGLFDVYHSVWFSAIYLMLVISLVGCIVPRMGVYWRGLRSKPPAAPRNLSRLSEHREITVSAGTDETLDRAQALLRRRRFCIVRRGDAVSAERGYLREAGNLLFHMSVLVVLAGVAIGNLFGYTGSVIIVTGGGFSNSLSQYDDFTPGTFFNTSSLVPFSFQVKDFDVDFITKGHEAGMAHSFVAKLRYRPAPSASWRDTDISVNHPLKLDGTNIYLLSHGYAPHITVRDGKGNVIASGPTVFLPEDDTFKSFGVVSGPDGVDAKGKPEQIGLEGELYPTYAFTMQTGPFSAFPDDKNPVISMLAYSGNLGLDNGRPQSIYSLDKAGLKPIRDAKGKKVRVDLNLGHTTKLPNGMGSVTFDGMSRFVKIQISHKPFDWLALIGMVLALVGLLGSLFIRPRRVWVRVRPADDPARTLVEVAGLDRTSGGGLGAELDAIVAALAPASAAIAHDQHKETS